ncbi:MAG: hypothetical protein LBC46_03195 [Treponema sp.]|nr:hypothetical protein [Treponema sp.]
MDMLWFARRRLLSLILMIYTAVSILGTFSFAALIPYQTVQSEIENIQDTIFDPMENFLMQDPAEASSSMFIKLGRVRFSLLCMSFQRAASLLIMPICSQSSFITSMRIHYSVLKNKILLKLRI